MYKKKVILFANSYETFTWHRSELARELKKNYEIYVILPKNIDSNYKQQVEIEFNIINVSLSRKGVNPFCELKLLIELFKILGSIKPDIIHNFTIKCILYGTIAGLISSKAKIINSITGLGYTFINNTFKAKIIRTFISQFYRFLFANRRVKIIFQNRDDMALFEKLKITSKRSDTYFIPGSGVNLDKFSKINNKTKINKIRFLYLGRLLIDKGIREIIQATELLKPKYGRIFEFIIGGTRDPENPMNISDYDFERLKNACNYIGFIDNPVSIILESDVVVLPSYREGLSKFLLEGMAAGKPLLASNVPGCADLVKNGYNGYTFMPKDYSSLKNKLEYILLNQNEISNLGENSRLLAEQYSTTRINQLIISLY